MRRDARADRPSSAEACAETSRRASGATLVSSSSSTNFSVVAAVTDVARGVAEREECVQEARDQRQSRITDARLASPLRAGRTAVAAASKFVRVSEQKGHLCQANTRRIEPAVAAHRAGKDKGALRLIDKLFQQIAARVGRRAGKLAAPEDI